MSPVYWALAILGIAGWLLGMAGWVLLGFIAGLHARRQRARDHEDQAIALTKPPAPAVPQRRAPGHLRGRCLRIDTWDCGCIWTWTQQTGWQQDFTCPKATFDHATWERKLTQ